MLATAVILVVLFVCLFIDSPLFSILLHEDGDAHNFQIVALSVFIMILVFHLISYEATGTHQPQWIEWLG